MMNVLIGCEESQRVCKEFRKRGHQAFSCDLKQCSGGKPDWHLKMDVLKAIKLKKWDLGIFFPDCTYLTNSANKWYKDQPKRKSGKLVGAERRKARAEAIKFFLKLADCKIPKICIENPLGIMSTRFRQPDQIIQPWMFGHGEVKATGLWLKNLPPLELGNVVKGRKPVVFEMDPSDQRSTLRSKTYPGIAKAMAVNWNKL